jgi:hypothetical protein
MTEEERRLRWRVLGETEASLGLPWDERDYDDDSELSGYPLNRDLRHVLCPQCRKPFKLRWNDDYIDGVFLPNTLIIRGCPSGGIYDVHIACPHCTYEESL